MLNSDDRGIGKKLLVKMIQNKVPGFCTELDEALDVMDLKADDAILKSDRTKIRNILKNESLKFRKKSWYRKC